MTQYGTLRAWAFIATLVGIFGMIAAFVGAIVWAFEVDGFWQTLGVLCIGLPVAVFIATLPIALAPTGMTGLSRWDGDVAAARAAEAAGTRLVLSTASSWTLEEVAAATEQRHWFQLYPYGNREMVGKLIKRAEDAGYTAMFVTVDVPARGNREREREAGMGVPLVFTPANVIDTAYHPRWLWNPLRHRRAQRDHRSRRQREGRTAARPRPVYGKNRRWAFVQRRGRY